MTVQCVLFCWFCCFHQSGLDGSFDGFLVVSPPSFRFRSWFFCKPRCVLLEHGDAPPFALHALVGDQPRMQRTLQGPQAGGVTNRDVARYHPLPIAASVSKITGLAGPFCSSCLRGHSRQACDAESMCRPRTPSSEKPSPFCLFQPCRWPRDLAGTWAGNRALLLAQPVAPPGGRAAPENVGIDFFAK